MIDSETTSIERYHCVCRPIHWGILW